MTSQREIKCEFFRIRRRDDPDFSFAECSSAIMAMPTVESRNWKKSGDYFRLIRFEMTALQKFYGGQFVRIRPNNVPHVCALDSDALKQLTLDEMQYPADPIHFIYVPAQDIIVCQRDRNVATAHTISEYISAQCQLKHLECEFFADSGSLEKFRRMRVITSVGVKLIYDYKALSFNETDETVASVMSMAETFGARELVMQFSVGRKRTELKAAVKEYIDRVLGWEGKVRAKAVVVRGSDESAMSYLLNLTNRKFDIVERVDSTDGTILTTSVWAALYNAYRKIEPQLREIGGAL